MFGHIHPATKKSISITITPDARPTPLQKDQIDAFNHKYSNPSSITKPIIFDSNSPKPPPPPPTTTTIPSSKNKIKKVVLASSSSKSTTNVPKKPRKYAPPTTTTTTNHSNLKSSTTTTLQQKKKIVSVNTPVDGAAGYNFALQSDTKVRDDVDDEDGPVEDMCLLRLPHDDPDLIDHVQMHVNSRQDISHWKLSFDDERNGKFSFGGPDATYRAKLIDLPTILEPHKSFDNKQFYKMGEISQMLLLDMKLTPQSDGISHSPPSMDLNLYKHWPDGISQPLRRVRQKRFRARKQNPDAEFCDDMVERLLYADLNSEETLVEVCSVDSKNEPIWTGTQGTPEAALACLGHAYDPTQPAIKNTKVIHAQSVPSPVSTMTLAVPTLTPSRPMVDVERVAVDGVRVVSSTRSSSNQQLLTGPKSPNHRASSSFVIPPPLIPTSILPMPNVPNVVRDVVDLATHLELDTMSIDTNELGSDDNDDGENGSRLDQQQGLEGGTVQAQNDDMSHGGTELKSGVSRSEMPTSDDDESGSSDEEEEDDDEEEEEEEEESEEVVNLRAASMLQLEIVQLESVISEMQGKIPGTTNPALKSRMEQLLFQRQTQLEYKQLEYSTLCNASTTEVVISKSTKQVVEVSETPSMASFGSSSVGVLGYTNGATDVASKVKDTVSENKDMYGNANEEEDDDEEEESRQGSAAYY